jgi:hypothetical protein
MNCAADELGSDFSDIARAGRDDTRGGVGRSVGRSEPTPGIQKDWPAVWGQGQSPAEARKKKEGRTMKELLFVLVAFWNTPATLDNGKCSACGRWHVTSTVVMAAISSCTAMYCGSGYYDEQGAFHALQHVHAVWACSRGHRLVIQSKQ